MSILARTLAHGGNKELLGIMIDAVEDYAIYMIDLNGTVMTWNKGAERNAGYRADEIVGHQYAQFFPSAARAADEPQAELDSARTRGRFRGEGWRIRKDGTSFWAVVTLTAMHDSGGTLLGFAVVTRDLSDRREKEIALSAAAEEAREAMEAARVANQAKSDFLANMSHELRTPLNAILGFSEMMMSEVSGPLGTKNLEYAGHIHRSGHHLLSLINDLLDFSKLDANAAVLELEDLDVHRIAQRAIETIQPQATKAGVVVRLVMPSPLSLRCDGRRVLQILLNLLSNAVKFTDEGGSVTLGAVDQQNLLCIYVKDTGIGMEPEEIPLALARFGQIESAMTRKTQGTGLGLPLVKQLVELHGGTVAIVSKKGEGTQVQLQFPKGEVEPRMLD